MKYYTLDTDANNYWFVIPKVSDKEEFSKMFDGSSYIDDWKVVDFEYY